MTHRAGVCCGGLLRRSSWCRRVAGQIITQRGSGCCRSSPPLLLQGDWCCCQRRSASSLSSVDSEPLGGGETSSGLGAHQLTNDREEGGADEGIKNREGGILCNGVGSTKERHQAHAFVIFATPPSLHPSSLSVSCSLSLFFAADLISLPVSPSGSSDVCICLWIEIVLIL